MGTQAGLDFCNKLQFNMRKIDQDYPLFFYITSLIYLEDQSTLEKALELCQIDLKIYLQKKNMKKF